MSLSKGDIVLVPFPFSDLSKSKLRPGVVLYVDEKTTDVTLCFVTSKQIDVVSHDEFVIHHLDSEFILTGLKVSSKVRVTKISTIEGTLVQRRLGHLPSDLIQMLNRTLENAFQLKG